MLVYHSRFLTRAEIWFDDEPDDRRVDWILYRMRSHPVPGTKCKPFHTFLVDLTVSDNELLARLHKDTIHKIKRARDNEKVVCETPDPSDPAVLDQFEEVYNRFAARKGLLPVQREILDNLAEVGRLDLSLAKDAQGNPLVYHANYRAKERVSGTYSVSLYRELSDSSVRNAIGRANRYLTWYDLLRYKADGVKAFDFGGWYTGATDEALLKINEFKRGFGGQIVREYQCEQILTLKAMVLLTVADLLNKARTWPQRSKQVLENHVHAQTNTRKVSASLR